MSVQRLKAVGWTFAVMCCAGLFLIINIEPETSEPVMKEQRIAAPDFTLQLQDGSTVTKEDLSGKPLILNFWTSWCPPCIEEIPELKSFVKAHPDITLIGVNMTKEEFKKESAEQFIKDHEFNFPVAYDEEGTMQKAFRIFTIPVTVIIVPDGYVGKTFFGPVTAAKLEEAMNQLLSENTAS
ncbi:hypothetical protein KP77_26650 [Jeotgalibacillus alimentarius]|uniref:Thioredoxin domain-containing protein n=1 Tax=Jeotgalibacillus alimentarius TaxID=135826 RepID=A0A0C2VRE2_9BACL|nr:TlpA disulfide reductase family protein [Jeotgalibacillus alimentarius]KIL46538.1 hypothetical protein KP77_26650 [Jeotgalibacillus alimentarius]